MILKNLNNYKIKINPGDILYLLGPSGSGKSNFINCICHAILNNRVIIFNNKNYINNVINIEFIFQQNNLFEHLSIKENLSLGFNNILINKKEQKILFYLLKEFNLLNKLNYFPKDLSGGQLQCIIFARSLIKKKYIFFIDEGFSACDMNLKRNIFRIIKYLSYQFNKIFILISHDIDEIKFMSSKILLILKGKKRFFGNSDIFFKKYIKYLLKYYKKKNE